MGRQLRNWELAGFFFTAAAGMLLHFTFGWSGNNAAAGVVSAVNESTWEHMKLLTVPAVLFTVVQLLAAGRRYPSLLAVRGISVLAGVTLIPVLFYTYTGILGFHVLWADIAIFFLADFLLFRLDFFLLRRGTLSAPAWQIAGGILLAGTLAAFVWCTFHPIHLPLWRDLAGGYGIP